MDMELPYKEGFLLVPFISALLKKKTWQKRYCKLFKGTKHGLQRVEIFETEGDSWKNNIIKFLTLDNCIKISPTPLKNQSLTFTIFARGFTQEFATLSESDLFDWVSCFQTAAFDKGEENDRPFNSNSYPHDDYEENNDLYCSANEGVFTVQVMPTPASVRCNLSEAHYTLVVNRTALQLRSALLNERLLYTWPFMYIRRYGSKNGVLSLDVGRKCDSGEGSFQFKTDPQKNVFQCISSTMKNWRVMAKQDDSQLQLSATPVNIASSQFQAAMNMEPGSRTPLPPSPTSATNSLIMNELSMSCAFENSVKNKGVPSKPPRKVPSITIEPKQYDEVEHINNAWKTLGVDEFTHTENYSADKVELGVKRVGPFKEEPTVITQRKFINQHSVESMENYDTLQHFAAPSANLKYTDDSAIYSQVNEAPPPPVPPAPKKPPLEPMSWNEYDVVGIDAQERFRVADDTHQGYGSIRKVSPQPEDSVYAEVVKPKKQV
ncbi:Hypothetical predicted protein [Cloeon dipterum]|uniref:Protein chico n=1 Tax=Cloeon dipterum TaxID=197152 RepID=A0A8S1DCK1_9INSE|nr:Hypothetical predicted protein [Cloeon dipterum]